LLCVEETGHTNYCGVRYCPNEPGQVPMEEWLSMMKGKAAVKKAAHRQQE